jgi:hypothetical protein
VNDQPERPHEQPAFEPAPPTEVGPPPGPPPAPPTEVAPPAPPAPSPAGGPAGGAPAPYQPYQQPAAQPGYGPYPGGGYPGGYPTPSPYQQPRSGGGGKIALIIVAVVVGVILLFCGGIVALVVWIAQSVDDALPDRDRPGGPDNPISVTEGEEFEIDEFEFESGWTVQADEYDSLDIVGLRAENTDEGGPADSIYVYFTFIDDNVELGDISCSASSVKPGRTANMDCSGFDDITGYDEIEVNVSY